MGNPTLIVVMLVYSTEKYIKECMDSALLQSFHNTEFFCIYSNGRSTDASALALEGYK